MEHEVFMYLHLDNKNQLIAFEGHFKVTVDHVSVYPCEIAKPSL